jgi:transposase
VERQAAQQSGATFDPRTFICTRCGERRDIDTLAAVNVGRKLVWLRQRRDQKAAGIAEDARTSWDDWLRDLLARDPSGHPS